MKFKVSSDNYLAMPLLPLICFSRDLNGRPRSIHCLKLVKKHERGDLPRLEWLDQLAFRKIERIHAVRLDCYSVFTKIQTRQLKD